MVKAVMNPVNKKVAFLTFKIVEETVKRMVLKAQTEKLMPFKPLTITLVKTALMTAEDSNSKESSRRPRNTSVSPKDRDHVKLVNLEDVIVAPPLDNTSKTAGNASSTALIAPFAKTGPIAADFQSQASSRNNQMKPKRNLRMQTFQQTGSLRRSVEGPGASGIFEKLNTETGAD